MREYKRPELHTVFIYFLIGTILLGLIRVFLLLPLLNIIDIDEITHVVIWHVIFYFALFAFYLGVKDLAKVSNKQQGSSKRAVLSFGAATLLFSFFLIITSSAFDRWYVNTFSSYFWEQTGLVHFIAFLQAGVISFYILFVRKKVDKEFVLIVTPLLITFAFFSLIHFWELLTESWKIFIVSEDVIELVESILAVPAYICIVIAFLRRYAPPQIESSIQSVSSVDPAAVQK